METDLSIQTLVGSTGMCTVCPTYWLNYWFLNTLYTVQNVISNTWETKKKAQPLLIHAKTYVRTWAQDSVMKTQGKTPGLAAWREPFASVKMKPEKNNNKKTTKSSCPSHHTVPFSDTWKAPSLNHSPPDTSYQIILKKEWWI